MELWLSHDSFVHIPLSHNFLVNTDHYRRMFEIDVCIIVGCLPILPAFFRRTEIFRSVSLRSPHSWLLRSRRKRLREFETSDERSSDCMKPRNKRNSGNLSSSEGLMMEGPVRDNSQKSDSQLDMENVELHDIERG